MIAHEAAADLYRELTELGADDDHAHTLLQESATLALGRIPALAHQPRDLERVWIEQELLDPPAAQRTAERLADAVMELLPVFTRLRARQSEIVVELLSLVNRVR